MKHILSHLSRPVFVRQANTIEAVFCREDWKRAARGYLQYRQRMGAELDTLLLIVSDLKNPD
jgi:hypothetical protein